MPPLGITPPARGGRARPVAPKPPRLPQPRAARPRAPDPNQVAQQNAMSAFRTALAQLQQSTPAVDQNAIYAPYRASQQITGQLGQGFQQAVQGAGQAAQDQAAAAHAAAQQSAAQFGISAGAGANATALPNTAPDALASQTAAYATAVPAATAQWQALLERTAAAKVNAAQTQRQQGLTAAEQSLSASIPGAIQNEKDLAFKRHAQGFNERLAESQLSDKKAADLRKYNLDVTRTNNQTAATNTRTTQTDARLKEQIRHDKATEKGARKRAQRVSKTGVQGVSQVLSAIKIAAPSASSTTKVAKGFDAQVVSWDGTTAGTHIQKIHVPRADVPPAGYKFVGTPVAHYNTVPAKAGAAPGLTLAQWNKGVGILLVNNKGMTRAQAMQYMKQITPKPPK